ncbi:MAG: hypothetical protein NUK65_01525 [Firmicutes bacterium]|nr:hypothetical protein [Bacillota bacterium]
MTDVLLVVFVSILAGTATYYIGNIMKRSSVLGSALVVLASGIVFPSLFGPIGSTLAVVAATASYAGMVSKENVTSLFEMVLVGAITGLIFIAATPAFLGVGGKLGTIAAISCLSFRGLKQVLFSLSAKMKGKTNKNEQMELAGLTQQRSRVA